jgi:hypothetical protein
MIGKIRAFIEKHIIAEVPPELSACLDCGVEQCLNGKWETCPNRLARAAALTGPEQGPEQATAVQGPEPLVTEGRPPAKAGRPAPTPRLLTNGKCG